MKPKPQPDDMPDEFIMWWSPTGVDWQSGAETGGHPDARRIWARKDPGCWVRRTYGIIARIAWRTQYYRDQYNRWIESGRPEREEFIGIAATLQRQKEYWHDAKPLLALMGSGTKPEQIKPMVAELNKKFPGYNPQRHAAVR